MPKSLVSKREKNEKQLLTIRETQSSYKSMIICDMEPVRTKLLHLLREKFREHSKIIFGKKTLLKKAFEKHDKQFTAALTANTFVIFTNFDTNSILETLTSYNKEKSVKIIKAGILQINNKPINTTLRKNLIEFIPVYEENGHLKINEDFVLDEKKHKKVIKLLKMDDEHMQIKPLYIFENEKYTKI
ncbi:60S acidic ribosomal protein P0 [Pseudoloma neurophilia]|uniref:60S acidic ribosomal protein P0 n=1 Tax=Pseudoloma neurophilia TaxID=146866 RepID=A0A0R0M1E1_9MICR|nr:60S acidic ribosomal protein P0 [Pseudoloma neurophilia]